MRFVTQILMIALAMALAPPVARAASNQSIPLMPYGELSSADVAIIDELAADFFVILQSEGTYAAFKVMPADESVLRGFKAQGDQLDYVCPKWDSVSAGGFTTLSQNVHQRYYYSIGDTCVNRWTLYFARNDTGWFLFNVSFYSMDQWK